MDVRVYSCNNEFRHHGIKGMKWGVRRYQKKDGSLTATGKLRYAEVSDKAIKTNSDGSKTVPKGFVFNRVGGASLDVNKSGALYVSYGLNDAARYVKNLGPTPLSKILGTASFNVQHISAKDSLRMPSDDTVVKETAQLLLDNKTLFKTFNDSLYSTVYTENFESGITEDELRRSIENPRLKSSVKLAYSVSSFLGDPNFSHESKTVYEHFRKCGYDAIPDLHDTLSGTSTTATIVINPQKLTVTSTTYITKEVMMDAKAYVKSMEKLKVSELIK